MRLSLSPARVGPTEAPSVVDKERIVPDMNGLALVPRIDADVPVTIVVIIAKVIVAVPGIAEQVQPQYPQIHADGRGKNKRGLHPHLRRKIRRGEEHPAIIEVMIPVSLAEDVATRCPSKMRRHPDPAGILHDPVAVTRNVMALRPEPAAGH